MHYVDPVSGIERKGISSNKWLIIAVCLPVLCSALFAASLTLLGVYQLSWSGPFRDIWEFIGNIQQQRAGHWSLDYLLDAYGGAHRILLPKIVFWADYQYFYGSNLLTTALSLLCQLVSLCLCWQLWRSTALSGELRLLLLAGMIAALFHAGQLFNFLYAMDVQWFMANTFALIALALSTQVGSWGKYWAALVFAILASLCNFTGLMAVLLIWFATCFLNRQRIRSINGGVFAAVVAAYVLWYVKTGKSSENFILARFFNSENIEQLIFITVDTLTSLAPFTLKMLSNPLSRDWPTLACALAFTSILFLIQQTWRLRRTGNHAQRTAVLWCWYIILGCCFTALGRIFYPNSATAERYLTLTLPYTVLIISLIIQQFRAQQLQTALAVICLPGALYFYSASSVDSLEKMTITSQQQHIAQAAARTDILDLNQVRGTLSFPMAAKGHNAVAEFNAWLAQQNLAYFYAAPFYHLHDNWEKVTERWPVAQQQRCNGGIHQQQRISDLKLRIEGQLRHNNLPIYHLLFSDGQQIVGFAYNRQPSATWLPWRDDRLDEWSFVGFINAKPSAAPYQVLGMSKRGQPLCYAEIKISQ